MIKWDDEAEKVERGTWERRRHRGGIRGRSEMKDTAPYPFHTVLCFLT
jgi:hypothetical protein